VADRRQQLSVSVVVGSGDGRHSCAMTTRFLKSRTSLPVRDVEASADFYERAVGLTVFTTMGDPPDFALLSDPETLIGLGLVRSDDPAVAPFACCYFDVDAVEELHRRCVAAGATVTSPLTHQPWGNYDFVVADPDGHQIAFGETRS
jgi:predicted enzyme related to lactoylglutathione lyase